MSYIVLGYNTIFYQPLFNALVWLYNTIPGHDIGLAIIFLTLVIRVILFPLYYQSIKSQRALQEVQPKVDALRKQYKEDQEKLAKELMILYKNENVNPFSSCLPLLIQLPFLIALYQVFIHGLKSQSMEMLYPFVHNPGTINTISLGFFNLLQPNIVLALLAGAAQFWQSKMMMTKNPPLIKGKEIEGSGDEKMTAIMNKQIVYFMPIFTVIIGVSLPSGLTLYWFLTTLLMALQQVWMFKKRSKNGIEGEGEKEGFLKINQ
ncbi:MAG: YidC/Oxa1 family membrane protein insertase [Candidatus Parcubacteria bacterium]|nr:YidC/Oxa1 family membrane protein insertase [Candidatus Parcubacteria bacterium]